MKRSRSLLVTPALLLGLIPVGVALGAVAIVAQPGVRVLSPAYACESTHLAAPRYQGPDTVDYFVEENVLTATGTASIHLGAYAAPGLGEPHVVATRVLDSHYNALTRPNDSGMWHVASDPCYPDPSNHRPLPGGRSDLYYFEGTWTAPDRPGSYELAVTFVFADSRVVTYLVNMFVVPRDMRHPPSFNTYIRDAVELRGLSETMQNIDNNAYNLDAIPDRLDLVTTYYFQGNPAPRIGQSKMANAMLDPTVARQDVFQNTGQGLLDNRITLPPSGSTSHFPYQQQFIAADGTIGALGQPGSVTVEPYAMPAGVVSDQSYTYRVVLNEPVTARMADGDYLLKVGDYAVDNGFFGPVADGRGTYGVNFGDGKGVTFYADPGRAIIDATRQHCDGDATRSCIYWDAVNPAAVGDRTAIRYHLTLVENDIPKGEIPAVITVTSTTPWADLDPRALGMANGARYAVTVQAEFQISSDDGTLAPPIWSDAMASTISIPTAAIASSSPTAAPTTPPASPTTTSTPTSPVDTSTPTAIVPTLTATATPISPTATATPISPTATATPQPPTSTATPLPPTATATSTPAVGAAVLAQTVVPYTWVRTYHGEDGGASDRLYASSGQHNADPSTFYWSVGRPLHLLPAVDENPSEDRLTIDDLGNGASTVLYPRSVVATDYTVLDAGAFGSSHCVPAGYAAQPHAYAHDAHYPSEVDPFSPRIVLVWASAALAGTLPHTTMRCDPTPFLAAGRSGPVAISYRVREGLVFDARFATLPPRLGGTRDCASQLASVPVAVPFSSEPAVPAPQPAFGPARAPVGPCPGGDVGLAAVRQALAHWRTEFKVADPNGSISGVTYGATGPIMHIDVSVERIVALHYYLLFRREVLP